MRPAVDQAVVRGDRKRAVPGRQLCPGQPFDEAVVAHSVLDQVGDRDHQEAVPAGESAEGRNARHRPVLVHDFADHAGRVKAGEARQIHRRLRLSGAHQHATVPRAQRGDMARLGKVRRLGVRIDRHPNRCGAVRRRDAGRRDVLGVDRHRERRLEPGGVLAHDHRDIELVEAVTGHRQTDQTATVARHEVDDVRRYLLGGDGEVALVLAILVIDDSSIVANRLLRRRAGAPARSVPASFVVVAGGGVVLVVFFGIIRTVYARLRPRAKSPYASTACATYFPMISHSRLAASPTDAA